MRRRAFLAVAVTNVSGASTLFSATVYGRNDRGLPAIQFLSFGLKRSMGDYEFVDCRELLERRVDLKMATVDRIDVHNAFMWSGRADIEIVED